LFGVSRQSLYQGCRRAAQRSAELSQIKPLVLEIRRRMPRLGSRKLYYLLKADFNRLGIKIGRDGLNEYLRSEHLLVKRKKNYTKTTNSKHWLRKYPNLMNRSKASRAEEFFVSDITYIKSRERTHYLALTTDAYSRKIMGYQLSDDLSAENTVKALQMAVKNRLSQKQLIHHSDRGLQYCSGVYQDELQNNQIKPSMTDGYDCYQNALAERINGILKQEFLTATCNTGKELEVLIKQSIETYNENRPHLSLGMKTPNYIHKKACEDNFTGSDKTN
jgi:putative transposase